MSPFPELKETNFLWNRPGPKQEDVEEGRCLKDVKRMEGRTVTVTFVSSTGKDDRCIEDEFSSGGTRRPWNPTTDKLSDNINERANHSTSCSNKQI